MANHPCDSVLVRDFTYDAQNEALAIATLDLVDRESFNQNKLAITTAADIIYGGTPMSGEGNYEQFNAKRERYHQERRSSVNYIRARTVVSQKASPESIAAWKDCMRNQRGFSCWVEESDDDSVRIFFNWNPPAGVLAGNVTVSTLRGGRSPIADTQPGEVFPVNYSFPPGAAFPLTFIRDSPEQDFELNVVLNGGYGMGLEVPGIPIIGPPPELLTFQMNELNFAATSTGNPTHTVTFSPHFRRPPIVYAAVCGMAVSGGQGQNYRIAIQDVTTHSATIQVRSGGDPTPRLQVRWLALEDIPTLPFRTADQRFVASSAGNSVQTITFSPPFQSPPVVYTAVNGLAVPGDQGQNYRTDVEAITPQGANIRIRSGGDPTPLLNVRWLAIQEDSTISFQTDVIRYPASPVGNPVQTITFPRTFRRPPIVYTAVCGMAVSGGQAQNYRTDVEAVDERGVTIRIRSGGDPTPLLQVRWLALGD